LPAVEVAEGVTNSAAREGEDSTSSTSVDQDPHCGQRPSQRGDWAPHSVHA
jgi:hypothetical protein